MGWVWLVSRSLQIIVHWKGKQEDLCETYGTKSYFLKEARVDLKFSVYFSMFKKLDLCTYFLIYHKAIIALSTVPQINTTKKN